MLAAPGRSPELSTRTVECQADAMFGTAARQRATAMDSSPGHAMPRAAVPYSLLMDEETPRRESLPSGAGQVRSPAAERALSAAIIATKALTIGFAIDAALNADTPRLRGKAIRTRAFGYVGALFIVPIAWSLLPNRGRYPRALDFAVTIPLLLDAGGNSLGLYNDAHIDDLVHIANSAIVSGVAGALFAPRVDQRWQAALAGAGVSLAGGSAWELLEYGAMRLGANGMNLTYDDTMADLFDGWVGAIAGAAFTLTRVPQERDQRKLHGWRGVLGLRRERPAL